jgi:5-methyltetrahydropteroyltriglutamate--homocysteine methyltransferase
MERSRSRILATHAGSLPRTRELVELFVRKSRHEPVDEAALALAVDEAVGAVVGGQLDAGIDVGNNGEQPRESFFTYVQHRMSGFGGESQRPIMRDIVRYPSFLQLKLPDFGRTMVSLMNAPRAVGPVHYVDRRPLERECAAFHQVRTVEEALRGRSFVEAFMTAPSPGIVACAMENAHYETFEAYVRALAEALRVEYEAVVGEGFVLQIDAPDLAMERHTLFGDRPLEDFLAFVDVAVEAINLALANVPPDRVRLHVCWGNYEGPHDCDVALEEVLPRLARARVGGLVLSMANPRHAHEHSVLARLPLPPDRLLVAGVIDTTTNYVEHPEVVAERIERAVAAVGDPTRVLAGTDCGFDTAAGLGEVAAEVVWEKLRALADGAALASRRLF